MADYNESLAYATFWRNNIITKLQHVTPHPVSFTEYIHAFYKYKPSSTFGLPLPYVYSLEWLDRFKDKCVTFQYNHPEEIAKGAAPLGVVYQLSPTLHCAANVTIWREEGGGDDGHITLFMVYEKLDEVFSFMDSNMDVVKKQKPKEVGFAIRDNFLAP